MNEIQEEESARTAWLIKQRNTLYIANSLVETEAIVEVLDFMENLILKSEEDEIGL